MPAPITLTTVLAVQAVAVAAASLLRAREQTIRQLLPYLVSLATGVLVGTALFDLLPESVEALRNSRGMWLAIALTLLTLFTLERAVQALTPTGDHAQAVHAHGPGCAHLHRGRPSLRPANLLLASGLHSFVDGTAIAVAFALSPRLGLLTALAVALHEVPHRLGDVAVLLHLGVAPTRALGYAALVGLPALAGAGAVLLFGAAQAGAFHWLLPVSAGSFLYIAGVNLLPEIQTAATPRPVLLQLLCLSAGALVVFFVTGLHAE